MALMKYPAPSREREDADCSLASPDRQLDLAHPDVFLLHAVHNPQRIRVPPSAVVGPLGYPARVLRPRATVFAGVTLRRLFAPDAAHPAEGDAVVAAHDD